MGRPCHLLPDPWAACPPAGGPWVTGFSEVSQAPQPDISTLVHWKTEVTDLNSEIELMLGSKFIMTLLVINFSEN